MADIELTPEEDAIYRQLLTYYAMGDVATEDVDGYIYDGVRMKGTFEGTSKFADRIKSLVDDAGELPDVNEETALERIGQKIDAVGPTLPPKPALRDIQRKVAINQGREKGRKVTRSLLGILPASLAAEVGARASEPGTGKYEGGKKKTRKSKKTRKIRKTRKYSRRR
jgi:hypothetical protein